MPGRLRGNPELTTIYNEIADTYRQEDYVFKDSHQTALKQVRDHTIDGRSNLKVVDFGVGHGNFLKDLHLSGNFDQLIGIDHSARMVDIAANQSPMKGTLCKSPLLKQRCHCIDDVL